MKKSKKVKCPVCKGKKVLIGTKITRRKGTLIPDHIRITAEMCPHCGGSGKVAPR